MTMRDGWRQVRLGDVASVTSSSVSTKSVDLPYIGLEHFDSGSPKITRGARSAAMEGSGILVYPGDVLFSKLRPYLNKVAVVQEAALCSTEVLVWRSNDPRVMVQDYLALVLRSDESVDYANARSNGTRMPRTSAKVMSTFPLSLPPLADQRRVVDLIAAVDDAIEAAEEEAERSNAASTQMRTTLFAGLADLPSVTASEKFDMLLGRQKSARQSVGDHVIPYVRSGNLGSGNVAGALHSMNFSPAEQTKYGLQDGDVLLAEGGTVGASARWHQDDSSVVGFDKHVIRLRGVPGVSTSDFAHEWVRDANASGVFEKAATGITIRALGFGRASALPVPDADLPTQDRIAAVLMPFDGAADAARATASALRTLRSNLLTVLLSGEHEIPSSYDQLLSGEETAA
ncbi:restriction endonuclease subunit S [Microbacterium protaetiae]|nr:restriction endonuclease subunit S [Microbacterium protaetiae]